MVRCARAAPRVAQCGVDEFRIAAVSRLLGAAIDGIGSNTLTIEGRPALTARPPVTSGDHIEIGSFSVSRRPGGA